MSALKSIQQLDLRMLLWCRKSRFYPQFIQWVRIVSRSGDGYMQILFPLLAFMLSPDFGYDFLLFFLYAFAIERVLYYFLKNTLKRRRPPDVVPDFQSIIQASDHFSFPSGHTMAAFLLAVLASFSIGVASLPLYLWASAVGASRVVLGVHFPTDILAGAVLGSSIAVVIHSFMLV